MNKDRQAVLEDKVGYVYSQLFKGLRVFRVVTPKGVESVLTHLPRNPRAITLAEYERINKNLIIPVSLDTIRDILRIAARYDRKIVTEIRTIVPANRPTDEGANSKDNDLKEPLSA